MGKPLEYSATLLLNKKYITMARNLLCRINAGVAQLVEYKFPKLVVASSILVARSKLYTKYRTSFC